MGYEGYMKARNNVRRIRKMDTLENRNVRKMILITPSLAEKLKKVSKMRNQSQNDLVNKGVESYLKRFLKK